MILKVLAVAILVAISNANDCIPRRFQSNSIVCVCNATYCDDTVSQVPATPEKGTYHRFTSSKDGLRLKFSTGNFTTSRIHTPVFSTVILDKTKTYQTIRGFGGAFTDAAGININKLSEPTQQQLIWQYFSPDSGSGYTLGRVPIAGTDFSTRKYTYRDTETSKFNLTDEDYNYKIPYIQKALELNPNIKFFAAAWSAPPWMKTNNDTVAPGFLRTDCYQVYADYIINFLEEYKRNGIDIWAVSTGNEPLSNVIIHPNYNKMGWTPKGVGKWIAENLGPSLSNSEFDGTKIMIIDDQRIEIPSFPQKIFENEKAKNYSQIIAVHWYLDSITPPQVLNTMHELHPDKELLMTEACTGSTPFSGPPVILGSWFRAEEYILDIMENLNHWMTGWVDWNIALSKTGGPNWANNFVDSPIIVEPDTDEFFKQPMYYSIKHFSRFVEPGSIRIGISDIRKLKTIAFLTPKNETIIILYNREYNGRTVHIRDEKSGIAIELVMKPHSIDTIKYKQ